MAYKKISEKALQSALKLLENNYGKDFAEKGLHESSYQAIPTGYDDLDTVLTRVNGGVCLGGVCEIYGSEGGGKTSLAMRTVGMAQKMGLNCAWFDAEHSFSPDLARLNQVDLETLLYMRRTVGEGDNARLLHAVEVLDRIYKTVWTGAFSLLVVDSVAALMPERVASPDFDPAKKGISELARDMSSQLPKISSACSEKECTVIFVNQVRMKPGEMYGNPETTPGGKALKFYASQRIEVNKINGKNGQVTQTTDGIEEIVGHYARVKVVKNRRNEPCFDPLEIPIYYREYFPDNAKRCYDLARRLQVITTLRGILTWKTLEGKIEAQAEGESNILQFIRGAPYRVPYLAECCVKMGESEKNTKKKMPIKVPQGIRKLASEYDPEAIITEAKAKKIKTMSTSP